MKRLVIAASVMGMLWSAQAVAATTLLITEDEFRLPPEEPDDGQDTAVYAFYTSLIRGDYPSLYAFSASESGQDHSFRTFLRIDYTQELAPDACIESAYLSIYYGLEVPDIYGSGVPNTPGAIDCRAVLEPWDEMQVSWVEQPSVGPVIDTMTGIDTKDEYYACDVTPLMRDWLDGVVPNYGIALFSNNERGVGMYSFEADVALSKKAALLVTIADDPQACPEPAAAFPMALIALGFQRMRRRR